MATTVIMPRQGQSVESCIMGSWYKEVGEPVRAGELLFSYETDKASFEEEAKAEGILLARYFEAGEEVPVLAAVAVIGAKGEEPPATGEGAEKADDSGEEEPAKVVEFPVMPEPSAAGRIHISPLARNMALKMGLDIAALQGSGPHGRIIARDVEEAAAAGTGSVEAVAQAVPEAVPAAAAPVSPGDRQPAPSGGPETALLPGSGYADKPLTHIRKLIASAMHQSLQNSAQLTHHLGADARKLLAARRQFKKDFESGVLADNVTLNDLLCYAVIRALKKYPSVNAHFLGDRLRQFSKVHLGLAVDTDRGLMVPALRDADDLSVTGLSARLRRIAGECRKGSINPDLLQPEAASFTVSNLGNYGVEMFTPVINLPQTAILGVCAIVPRPVEVGEGVYAIVPVVGLSLTYDHRALDGGEATRFLAEVRSQIENLTV